MSRPRSSPATGTLRSSRRPAPARPPHRVDPGEPVLRWLLSPEQPASRYRVLRDLMGRSEDDRDVRASRREIPRKGWARALLARQKPAGHWESPDDLYRPKYLSTIWNFQVLAELGVTRDHPAFARTCELFLDQYARKGGGFDSPPANGGRTELCVSGNVTRALLLAGYGDDQRVRAGLDWLVRTQLPDGGWHCFPQVSFGRGTLDCWEGLNAFAALPPERWSPAIRRSIERSAEFYLRHELLRQGRSSYAPWRRLHFPRHYYYDVLVGLDMLTALGFGGDLRLGRALAVLESKRRPDGTWVIDRSHPDLGPGAGYDPPPGVRPLVLERPGTPSRWVTGTALRIRQRAAVGRASDGS